MRLKQLQKLVHEASFLTKVLLTSMLLTLLSYPILVLATPPSSPYTLGETLNPSCAPGSSNCSVVLPAASGDNSDITTLTGLTSASITNTDTGDSFLVEDEASDTTPFVIDADGEVGIGNTAPGQKLHITDGNVLMDASGEVSLQMKRAGTVGNQDNPIFQIGRIIASPPINEPQFRILYSDDDTSEITVLDIESTGTTASVRATDGSHFEGFISGETYPLFRLNSSPSMQLELGAGNTTDTDTFIRRSATEEITFLTGSTPTSSMVIDGANNEIELLEDVIITAGNLIKTSGNTNNINIDDSGAIAAYARGNILLDLDTDDNQTDRTFFVTRDNSSENLLELSESGALTLPYVFGLNLGNSFGGNVGFEIGNTSTATTSSEVSYMDFHFGNSSAQDYNVRIQNNADKQLSLTPGVTSGSVLDIDFESTDLAGDLQVHGRALGTKGSDVASANDITLGDGNYFDITGTTQINTIVTTGWTAGSTIILQFDASVTVKHNTAGTGASLLLSGAADFSASADDTLMLIFDGTTWREVSRTVI